MQPKNTTANRQRRCSESHAELAAHISAILNHPDTPACIYHALGDAVCSIDAPKCFFNSEEYIAMCLRNHFTGGAR